MVAGSAAKLSCPDKIRASVSTQISRDMDCPSESPWNGTSYHRAAHHHSRRAATLVNPGGQSRALSGGHPQEEHRATEGRSAESDASRRVVPLRRTVLRRSRL